MSLIICADNISYLENSVDDDSVDLTVTSPPYDDLRTYGTDAASFTLEKCRLLAAQLLRVTEPGGVVVWVVGDGTYKGGETGTAFRQALLFQEVGFTLFDTMIYEKTGTSFPSKNRYTQIFEYMFVFSKGVPKTFNPICDVPKLWEGSWGRTTQRNKDGTLKDNTTGTNGKGKSGRATDGRYGCKQRTNIWRITNGKGFGHTDDLAYQHPATFPEKLVEGHILTWSHPGDLVLDPFNGSGTTCKVAKQLERNYLGIDSDRQYCRLAEQRIALLTEKE